MIDSTPTASGAVVDQRSARSPEPVVEADAGRQAEEAGQDALAQAGHGARPVPLEREQILAGPEDRLDALADGGQVRALAGFVLARRPYDRGAQLGHGGHELTPGVALVAEEGLTAAALATRQQLKADLVLVPRGRSRGERPRRTVGRADGVQAQAPEAARVGGAVAVARDLGKGRALGGLAAAAALDRGRVAEQQIGGGAGTLRGEVGQEPLDRLREAPAALVVAGLVGQLGNRCPSRFFAVARKRRSLVMPMIAWATQRVTTSASVSRRRAFLLASGKRSSAVQ